MNRLDSNGRTMTRRNGVGVKVVLTVAAGLFVIYCLYSYHEIHTRLKKSEEKGERLRQQHDSLSAQLQVVYEHKSRLEKTLQQEKGDHRKSKNDLMSQKSELETRFYNEKQELLNRISSINQEHKMLQSQHEDVQMELSKLQEAHNKLQEDNQVVQSQHNAEYQQLKQEKENELASLKDEVANMQRKNLDLQKKLDLLMQSNQYNMQQVEDDQKTIHVLKQQISDLQVHNDNQKQQQQFVQQQQQKQPLFDGQQHQNNQIDHQDPLQQQQQFGLNDQGGFPKVFNQHNGQQQQQQQQFFQQPQQGLQQDGVVQQNQFIQQQDTLHQQQPAMQQQFNQQNQVPIVQQKQPGDTVNFQPQFGDGKLADQQGAYQQQPRQEQQAILGEQHQQNQEEQNNQINQMQVNPPDLNKENEGNFRGRRFPVNRDNEDEEVQPGRLRHDFPDESLKKKDDGVMQIGKPRFADGGLGQPNLQSQDRVQAPAGDNQIQMPKVDQNVVGDNAKEVDNQEEEEEEDEEENGEQAAQPNVQDGQQMQQMQRPDLAHRPGHQLDEQEEYDGDDMKHDHQLVPGPRAGRRKFRKIKQPRPDDDVYHNVH